MAKTTAAHGVRHQRTRDDHATETAEDYVEAVDELVRRVGQCRVKDLAARFAVSHVTVIRTVARLKRDGWLQSEPYGPVRLTAKGSRLARRSRERHEVVFQFLTALGVQSKTAAIDTEGIEHHVSRETLAAMKKFLRQRKL